MTAAEPAEDFRPRRFLLSVAIACVAWWLGAWLPFPPEANPEPARACLFVTALTTSCWLTSAMPLAAASLLPLALLPPLGVASTERAGAAYADPVLWLFGAGFVLAQGIERWGLHRRLSLWVLILVGPHPRRLVLGFMLSSTLLSLWINNTSTALMLLPIGWALVQRATASSAMPAAEARRFGVAVMLAIAYGASFGGIGTPIGTAPNALFFTNYEPPPGVSPVSFLQWVLAFAPLSLLLALCGWVLLTRVSPGVSGERLPGAVDLGQELRQLGRMTRAERRIGGLFLLAVLLWMTRADLRLGKDQVIAGWARRLLPADAPRDFLADGTVAVAIAVLAFLIPAGAGDGRRLMDWATARRIPFEILFLLGGGIALADAFGPSGLSAAFGNLLAPLVGRLHPLLLLLLLVAAITLLSEIGSNTAIAALFLPLMAAAASRAGIDARTLMLPVTIAASCGFMLPIATPPNALVFGTGHVSFREMARAGFWVDLLAVALLVPALWFWSLPLLGAETGPVAPR